MFASDNSTKEWGLQGLKTKGCIQFVLRTNHEKEYVETAKMSKQIFLRKILVLTRIHTLAKRNEMWVRIV